MLFGRLNDMQEARGGPRVSKQQLKVSLYPAAKQVLTVMQDRIQNINAKRRKDNATSSSTTVGKFSVASGRQTSVTGGYRLPTGGNLTVTDAIARIMAETGPNDETQPFLNGILGNLEGFLQAFGDLQRTYHKLLQSYTDQVV